MLPNTCLYHMQALHLLLLSLFSPRSCIINFWYLLLQLSMSLSFWFTQVLSFTFFPTLLPFPTVPITQFLSPPQSTHHAPVPPTRPPDPSLHSSHLTTILSICNSILSSQIPSSAILWCLHLSPPNLSHDFHPLLPHWIPAANQPLITCIHLSLSNCCPTPPHILMQVISSLILQSRWMVSTWIVDCPFASTDAVWPARFLQQLVFF